MRFQRNLFLRLTTPNLPATRLPPACHRQAQRAGSMLAYVAMAGRSPGTKGRFNATVRGNGGQVAMCWHCSYLASQALAGGGVHINPGPDLACNHSSLTETYSMLKARQADPTR